MEDSTVLQKMSIGNLKAPIVWKEEDPGEFVGVLKYDNTISVEMEKELNDINWKKLKIAKKSQIKLSLNTVKPGDILYDPIHGYIRVDTLPPPSNTTPEDVKWECYKQQEKQENEDDQQKDPEKITISPLKLTNLITVNATLQINEQLMTQTMKLNVTSKINEFLEPLSNLYNVKVVAIWNNKNLHGDWTLYDHGIKDGDRIWFLGVKSVPSLSVGVSGGRVRFFKRFPNPGTSSWYIGRESWDGLILVPSRTIKLLGVGIYEFYPNSNGSTFTLGYKYILKDSNDAEITASPVYEEVINPANYTLEERFFKYKFTNFPNGITIRAGEKLTYLQWIQGQSNCYYSENGGQYREIVNEEPGILTLEYTSLSTNSTTVDRGIIPGFLYS